MKDAFTPLQIEVLADVLGDLMLEVDRRIAAQPAVHHCGIYKDGAPYKSGSLVTRSGSLWLAKTATTAAPGSDAAWQLVCKGNGHANGAASPRKHIATGVRRD